MDSTRVLPIFPLPLVQFPGVMTPLHIFEPRYRQMLKDVTEGDKTFGILAVKEGEAGRPLLGSMGCSVEIAAVQELPDGRSNILCLGGTRFRLLDYVEGEPYLQGRVEFFDDETAFDDFSEEIKNAKDLFARLVKVALKLKEQEHEEEVPELPDDAQPLSFILAAYLDLTLTEKQEMLELTDTGERLRRINDQLQDLVEEYEKRAKGRQLSKLNGHGGKPPKLDA